MRNNLKSSLLIMLVISLFLAGCTKNNSLEAASINQGKDDDLELAPDFKLSTLKNEIITLSNYRSHKPVLLLFWTTWCPLCRGQLILANKKYAALSKDDGPELLAINVGESVNKVEKFVEMYNLSYPVLLDKDTGVANSYGILGIPTYVLINKNGQVVLEDNSFPEKAYKELITQ